MGTRTHLVVILCLLLAESSLGNVNNQQDPKSVAFLIDTTGSMATEVEAVKKMAIDILESMAANENLGIGTFILVPFNDPDFGPATTTNDPVAMKALIKDIRVYGGGDCPELYFSGLKLAVENSLRDSYVFAFTDAPPKDVYMQYNVTEAAQKKMVQVTTILTNGCHYSDADRAPYNELAQATSGQLLDIAKTDVSQVMKYIETFINQKDKIDLETSYKPAGNYTYHLSIDISITIITISLAGSQPSIVVMNPFGEIVTNTTQINITLSLDKIQILNIIKPEPGEWSISAGCSSNHSVKIMAESDIKFDFGFTVGKLSEIFNIPLQGVLSNLIIKLFDDSKKIEKLDSIDIIDINGTAIILELIKLKLSSTGLMYITKNKFVIPSILFSITINGIDIDGHYFKRKSSTSLLPELPGNSTDSLFAEIPVFLDVNATVTFEYGQTAVIFCNVTGIPEPEITWFLPDGNSTEGLCNNYIIRAIRHEDQGEYRCTARNYLGEITGSVQVNVKEKEIVKPEFVESNAMSVSGKFTTIFSLLGIVRFMKY